MKLDCFHWNQISADHLHGLLESEKQTQADQHLATCQKCNTKYTHFKRIIDEIRANKTQIPLPDDKSKKKSKISQWKQTPLIIRSSVEALGLGFVVFIVVALLPRVKNLYNSNLNQSADVFDSAELGYDEQSPVTSASKKYPAKSFSDAGNSENEAVEANHEQDVVVGNSEIWRFTVRTESPDEFRPKIVEVLSSLEIPDNVPGLEGLQAPGGIQFNIFLPIALVPKLKNKLEEVISAIETEGTIKERFSWYKSKKRRGIPKGKARVVIWLSQI